MRRVRYLAALVTLALGGCGGGSPAGPSNVPVAAGGLPFSDGAYLVSFIGGSLECGDVKNPQAGTSVSITLQLRRDGSAWTGTAGNALTFQFQPGAAPAGPPSPSAIGITGTARGSANDEGILLDPNRGQFFVQPNGTRITFPDNTALSGSFPSPALLTFSQGRIDGTVTFSRNGVTSTCPPGIVGWTMNKIPVP